jgi:hypothetical protein
MTILGIQRNYEEELKKLFSLHFGLRFKFSKNQKIIIRNSKICSELNIIEVYLLGIYVDDI